MKRIRIEQLASLFVAFAAIFSSTLYFTGARFLEAKAETLGLAADIGDAPFQKTVVLGASLLVDGQFFIPFFGLIFAIFATFGIVYLLATHPRSPLAIEKLARRREELGEDIAKLRAAHDEAAALSGNPDPDVPEIAAALAVTEVEANRLKLDSHLLSLLLGVPSVLSFVGLGLLLMVVVVLGRDLGRLEALEQLMTVRKDCNSCMIFQTDNVRVRGLAVLQSSDTLVILHRDGLVVLPLDQVIEASTRPVNLGASPSPQSSGPKVAN